MDAAELLAEYLGRHDAGVRTGDWAPLAALFAEDGEVSFHGIAAPPMRGRAGIEHAFRTRGPGDVLVGGTPESAVPARADCVYGWGSLPGLVAGKLWLEARGSSISHLRIVVLPGGPMRPLERDAVRALVLSPDERVLLLRCSEPLSGATWWITPGGGVEPGETDDAAIRRELREEVGLEAPDAIGAPVWTREHVWCWGPKAVRQRERYFLVRTQAAFEPRPCLSAEELAREGIGEAYRWWTVAEIAAAEDVVFAPRAFARHAGALLRDGPPAQPLDVGV